jgi:hypothetical protein
LKATLIPIAAPGITIVLAGLYLIDLRYRQVR